MVHQKYAIGTEQFASTRAFGRTWIEVTLGCAPRGGGPGNGDRLWVLRVGYRQHVSHCTWGQRAWRPPTSERLTYPALHHRDQRYWLSRAAFAQQPRTVR